MRWCQLYFQLSIELSVKSMIRKSVVIIIEVSAFRKFGPGSRLIATNRIVLKMFSYRLRSFADLKNHVVAIQICYRKFSLVW